MDRNQSQSRSDESNRTRFFTSGRIFFLLYPLIVLGIVLFMFPRWASAGQIRKLVLSPERPGVINLAYGNATAVSFQSKPEKLVPGSPQKVEINFLGKDITVSPLMANPGNLLIYTSGSRYVLLFRVVPEAMHDDVVEIIASERQNAKPIRLDRDSYHVENVKITVKPKKKWEPPQTVDFSVVAYSDRLTGEDFSDFLTALKRIKCEKCVVNTKPGDRGLVCLGSLPSIVKCQSDLFREIEIKRGSQ